MRPDGALPYLNATQKKVGISSRFLFAAKVPDVLACVYYFHGRGGLEPFSVVAAAALVLFGRWRVAGP